MSRVYSLIRLCFVLQALIFFLCRNGQAETTNQSIMTRQHRQVSTPSYNSPPVTSSATTPEWDFRPYIENLRHKIKQNWHHPANSTKYYITVYFEVLRNGQLRVLKLDNPQEFTDQKSIQSIQYKAYAQSCLEAVRRSVPFEELPKDYKYKLLPILFNCYI